MPKGTKTQRHKVQWKSAGRVMEESYRPAVQDCKAQVEEIMKRRGKYVDRSFDVRRRFDKTMGKCHDPSTPLEDIRAMKYVDITIAKKECGRNLRMFSDGFEDNDIVQGGWGTCFLLSSFATLTSQPALFKKLFVKWSIAKSVYGFVFFIDGEWTPVVIDGKVLVRPDNSIAFASSPDPCELWPSLLEKAYAKAMGSWANVDGGFERYCMATLCGGVTRPLTEVPFDELQRCIDGGTHLLGCAVCDKYNAGSEAEVPNGLYSGHAYSIHKTAVLSTGERLVQCRNPWGSGEYNGPFSDEDSSHLPQLKQELGYEPAEDGKFWITWEAYEDLFGGMVEGVRLFASGWALDKINACTDVAVDLSSLQDTCEMHDVKQVAFKTLKENGAIVIRPQGCKTIYLECVESLLRWEEYYKNSQWYSDKLLVAFEVVNETEGIEDLDDAALIEVLTQCSDSQIHFERTQQDMNASFSVNTNSPETTVWVVVPCISNADLPYDVVYYYNGQYGEPDVYVDLAGWDEDEDEEEEDEEEEDEEEEEDDEGEYEETGTSNTKHRATAPSNGVEKKHVRKSIPAVRNSKL